MSENNLSNWSDVIYKIHEEDSNKRKKARNVFNEKMKSHEISQDVVDIINMCNRRQQLMIRFTPMGIGNDIEDAVYSANEIKKNRFFFGKSS